jgi:hypothetical protein
MRIFLIFILIFALTGCGKNPVFSFLPEPVSGGGGGSSDVLLEEGFNTYSILVNGINGWSVLTSGNVSLSISNAYYKEGGKSLKINYAQGSGSLSLKKSFTNTSSMVFLEEYVYVDESSDINPAFLGLYINDTLAVSVKRGGGKFIGYWYDKLVNGNPQYSEQTIPYATQPFYSDTWYKVKVKLDTQTWKWTLWINDNVISDITDKSFNTDSSLSGFVNSFGIELSYTNKADNDVFYIDEIKITKQ